MICCAMLCYAMLCYAVLYNAMVCYIIPPANSSSSLPDTRQNIRAVSDRYCAILCYAMLCYDMIRYAVLCCAIQCNGVLYYTTHQQLIQSAWHQRKNTRSEWHILYGTVRYAMLCYAMLCSMRYNAMVYYTIPPTNYTIPPTNCSSSLPGTRQNTRAVSDRYCTVPYVMLCYAMLCNGILCYTTRQQLIQSAEHQAKHTRSKWQLLCYTMLCYAMIIC